MVTVNKHNFLKQSNLLISKLPSAAYVSIDLEMTGITVPSSSSSSPRPHKADTPNERYSNCIKSVPERYNIIQVGIALFHENPVFRKYVKRQVYGHDHDSDDDIDKNTDEQGGRRGRKRKQEEGVARGSGEEDNKDDDDDGNSLSELARRGKLERQVFEEDGEHELAVTRQQHNIIRRIAGHHNFEGSASHIVFDPHGNVVIATNHQDNSNDNGQSNQGLENNDHDINSDNDEHHSNDGDDDDNDGEDDDDDESVSYHSQHSGDGDHHDEDEDQEPPEFLVHKFNFFLFPAPQTNRNMPTREVTLNPSSIAFLNEQEMDFREWIVHGIPYTTLDNASQHLEQFHAKYEKERKEKEILQRQMDGGSLPLSPPPLEDQNINNNDNSSLFEPVQAHDIAFIARSMASLREWIDSAAPPIRNISGNLSLEEEERMGIVKLVPTHRKETLKNCLHRKIKCEYPSLHWYKHNSQNYVLRLSEDEKQIRDERLKRVEWEKMHTERIGFARVFKALTDACCGELGDVKDINDEYQQFLTRSEQDVLTLTPGTKKRRRIPIVVHNGLMDLLFLLTHFHSDILPSNFLDTKELIHRYFPIVYDTKVIATECVDFRFRSRNSALAELYQRHVMGIQNLHDHAHTEVLMRLVFPRVEIVNDLSTSTHRDAGDDAFMAGAVFQCLSRLIMNDSLSHADDMDIMSERAYIFIEMVNECIRGVGSLLFLDEVYANSNLTLPQTFGRNFVFLPHSIYSIRLDNVNDPLKSGYSTSTIFHISNIDNRTSLDMLHDILSKTRDNTNAKVPYEIFSLRSDSNDYTVAARIKTPRGNHTSIFNSAHMHQLSELLETNGYHIRQSLENHFSKEYVTSWEENMNRDLSHNDCEVQEEEVVSSSISSFVTGFFDTFGLSWLHGAKRNNEGGEDESGQRGKKRRRID